VAQVDLDQANFISNDDLDEVLSRTTATPEQVDAAVALNEEQRLRTLKIGFLILAGISAAAALPASRLPRYTPGEIPAPSEECQREHHPRRRLDVTAVRLGPHCRTAPLG